MIGRGEVRKRKSINIYVRFKQREELKKLKEKK